MKARLLILAVLIAIAIYIIFNHFRGEKVSGVYTPEAPVVQEETTILKEDPLPTLATPSGSLTRPEMRAAPAGTSSSNETMDSSKYVSPVAKLIPPLAKVRDEVAKDPHSTPESVTVFSLGLGQRLDAIQTEQQARDFMNELDTCVNDPPRETVTSARTLCLLNARKVARKYPALDAAYANLEGRADENVKSALALME